jgi:hypothetical protein
MEKRTATRISIICATIGSLLLELPEQPFKAQLIDLARIGERDADSLSDTLSVHETTRSAA